MTITDEQFNLMSKPELIELLKLALDGQKKATENMQTANDLLEQAAARIRELEGRVQTQEAELLVLRNK
jgi:hypothetical protein